CVAPANRVGRARRLAARSIRSPAPRPTPGACLREPADLCSACLLRNLHMARSDALQGALPMLVLKILARRGPMHGYAITTQIEGFSSDVLRVEEGSLYTALPRL